MANGAGWQQQQELLEQQELLTEKSYFEWLDRYFENQSINYPKVYIRIYLREHGLPLNSKIEGL